MTRVNTIPAELLLDEWLIAEYRELKRIPNNVRNGKYICGWIPETYRLGFGHERFFIDKLLYLKIRHDEIRDEMYNRFRKEYDIVVEVYDLPEYLLNDWVPSSRDHALNVERLIERFEEGKYRYYGSLLTQEMFEEVLDEIQNECGISREVLRRVPARI